ncbi:hypothetical protein B484DRAFT_436961 [Ochromonadaceae sp. CCMP2298]|nr:hypothetical protein B484DRAFT_436961 [Ochromonadaceae sp. CCMP2298]
MRTQSEILKLKLTFIQDVDALVNEKNLLAQAFKNMAALLSAKDGEVLRVLREKRALEQLLDDMTDHGENSKLSHAQEVQKIRAKYQGMKAQFKESEEKQQSLIAENESLERAIAVLKAEKLETQQQRDAALADAKAIALSLEQTRTENQLEMADMHEGRMSLQAHYEQIIDQLGYENEYLRATCTEQEAQIERLTNSLIGNKSHFARYVEVKTENLTLQSKLKGFEGGPGPTLNGPSSKRVGGFSAKGPDFAPTPAFAPGMLPAHRKRGASLLAAAGASAFDGGAVGVVAGGSMRGAAVSAAFSAPMAAGPASAVVRDILDNKIPDMGLPPPQPSVAPPPVSPQTSPRGVASTLPAYLPAAANAIKPLSTKETKEGRRVSPRASGGVVGTALGGAAGVREDGEPSPRTKKTMRIQPAAGVAGAGAAGAGAGATAVNGAQRLKGAAPAPSQPRSIRFAEGVGEAVGGDKVVVAVADSSSRERPARERQVQVF